MSGAKAHFRSSVLSLKSGESVIQGAVRFFVLTFQILRLSSHERLAVMSVAKKDQVCVIVHTPLISINTCPIAKPVNLFKEAVAVLIDLLCEKQAILRWDLANYSLNLPTYLKNLDGTCSRMKEI